MEEKDIRKMIKEEVASAMREAVRPESLPPKTLSEFRKLFATCLEEANAPDDIVFEVGDVGTEGAGIFEHVIRAWQRIESAVKLTTEDKRVKAEWRDLIEYFVHDAVIDMVNEYSNPWNHAPGHVCENVDPTVLATNVCKLMKKSIV